MYWSLVMLFILPLLIYYKVDGYEKLLTFVVVSFVSAALFCGCKEKNTSGSDLLQNLVEEINNQPDKTFTNGTVLDNCEYKQGDSVFVFHVKVPDNRFDKVDGDSLKNSVAAELSSKKMHKLTSTLAKHAIGIKYIFEQEDKEVVIEFAPSEFSVRK